MTTHTSIATHVRPSVFTRKLHAVPVFLAASMQTAYMTGLARHLDGRNLQVGLSEPAMANHVEAPPSTAAL